MASQAPTAEHDSFSRSLRSLSRRWTLDILELLLERPCRFSEIRRAFPDLSERVMWERLRELTAAGLISREVDPGPPIRSIYQATGRAADVRTSIEELRAALGLSSVDTRP